MVSGPSLYAVAGAVFLLLVFLGFLLTRVGDLAGRASLAERLGKRNAELEESLLKIQALEQELAGLRQFDREIREWAGLPPSERELSTGGEATAAEGGSRRGVGSTDSPAAQNMLLEPARLDADAAGLDAKRIGLAHPLIWPLEGWVSSEFKEPRGAEGPHTGIDLVAARGTPVVAAAAGRVQIAGGDAEYGRVVVIDHGGSLSTLYGHNAELTVRPGEKIARGQRIASVGSTGRSTAPHLHFEVRQDGYALDPRCFLPAGNEGATVATEGATAATEAATAREETAAREEVPTVK